ncbi:hypothetical protein BJ944DRAFT_157943 [Cunninghamella echinulata]|nr:hypothetical protein BJ944DRAFT_157943 [Cunninghamella echinulata]
MDKFINAFSRSQYKKDEEGRSYQFAKRLSTTTTTSIASPYSAASTKNSIPGPTLSSSYLSVIELDIYNKWWEGLDPFGLGVAHEEAVHPFLESSGLETNILQQVIIYENTGEVRYTEEQFFAILRLIAHIQNGRKMNRDLVALGGNIYI